MKHLCEAPTAELCSQHKCPHCKGIVHMQCGVFDEDTDEYICNRCFFFVLPRREKEKQASSASARTPASAAVPPQKKVAAKGKEKSSAKVCPACGGTDHQRRTSKKCKHFNKKKRAGPPNTGMLCTAVSEPVEDIGSKKVSNVLVNESGRNNNKKTNSTTTSTNTNPNASLSKPRFINLMTGTTKTPPYYPVIDVDSDNFTPTKTIFKAVGINERGRRVEIPQLPQFC